MIADADRGAVPPGVPAAEAGAPHRRVLAAVIVAYCVLGIGAVAVATLAFPLAIFPTIRVPAAPFGIDPGVAGVGLWIGVCLATSTQGASAPNQVSLVYSTGAILAAALLGGPTAAAWVALVGTIELRELRGEVPWYGVLATHGMLALSATMAAVFMLLVRLLEIDPVQLRDLAAILVGAAVFLIVNQGLALLLWHSRTGRRAAEGFDVISRTDWNVASIAEACLAWLVALAYFQGLWWAPVVMIVADVAASRSMAHHRATWQLQHHPLTGLPNGRLLREHVARLRRRGTPTPACLCYLDLDGFKAVNDDHGHDVGDDVLREVGRRLGVIAGPDVFVTHLHGDEFVVLATGMACEPDAEALAGQLRGLVDPPIDHRAGVLRVTATVGTERMPDLDDLDGAMRAADRRMLAQKAEAWELGDRERRRR